MHGDTPFVLSWFEIEKKKVRTMATNTILVFVKGDEIIFCQ
jgi:hypothetical protein